MLRFLVLATTLLAASACGSEDGTSSCAAGSEGCACYGNSSCDVGLDCRSMLCVALGNGGSSGSGGSSAGTGGTAAGGASTVDSGGAVARGGTGTCSPACGARVCGPDPQCGTSCGNCAVGLECTAGECRSPTPLKENGATCSTSSECASETCQKNQVGETHCYGSVGPNGLCSDSYDCAGGACFPRLPGGAEKVCVVGVNVCLTASVSGQCTAATVAFCELVQKCGANVSSNIPARYTDFDYCVGAECGYAMDGVQDLSPAECSTLSTAIANGTAPCP